MFRKTKLDKFAKEALSVAGDLWVIGTIIGQNDKEECIQKHPLPFLWFHEGDTQFWPDLASCHYVVFVPKEANPPDSPELHTTEKNLSDQEGQVSGQLKMLHTQ